MTPIAKGQNRHRFMVVRSLEKSYVSNLSEYKGEFEDYSFFGYWQGDDQRLGKANGSMLVFLSTQYGITIAKQRKITPLRCTGRPRSFGRGHFELIIKNAYATKGIDKNIRGFNQKAAETFPLNNWCNALSVPHPGQYSPVNVKNKQGGVNPCSLGSRAHIYAIHDRVAKPTIKRCRL